MSNSSDPSLSQSYVLPKPGVPKTLGILSVIFAVVGILYGLCTLGITMSSTAIMDWSSNTLQQAQKQMDDRQAASFKALDDQEKLATTDAEKASIQAQRNTLKAQPRIDAQVASMDTAKEALKNPTMMGAAYAQLVTGLALMILLLISGINLIRLRPSGRKLGVTWAVLQIVQLFLLVAVQFTVIQPINKPIQDKQLAALEEQAAKGNNPAAASTLQLTKIVTSMAPAFLIGFLVLGSIYPAIMLLMLNGQGARAALQGPKSIETPEFS